MTPLHEVVLACGIVWIGLWWGTTAAAIGAYQP